MIAQDRTIAFGELSENNKKLLLNSPLYECLKIMPKPAVHHAHLTACADIDFLISLTYKDCVYFS